MNTKWLLSAAGSALACMIVTTAASAAPVGGMKLDTPTAQAGGATVHQAHWYGGRRHWRHWGWRHHRHGWHRGW